MILGSDLGDLHEPLAGRRRTGAQCVRLVHARAAVLRAAGVTRGARVFLLHGNSIEFFIDLVALWRLGACAVPVDPRFTDFEIETLVRAATPSHVIHADRSAEVLQQLGVRALAPAALEDGASSGAIEPAALPDDPALILFTSGSTGRPKGVVHSHRTLLARWIALRDHLGTAAFRRTLCLLPTHFGHGLICNSLFPWLSGGELNIVPPYTMAVLTRLGSLVDDHRITFMSSVPTVWRLALKTARPPRTPTLERVFCGSAPLSAALWRDVQRWSGAKHVANVYGITETGSWLAGLVEPDAVPEDGLIGSAWGGAIRICDPTDPERTLAPGEAGQVRVSTPALMQGYYRRDDLTAAAVRGGWFLTGDIGALDDRGRLVLRGRDRDEINVGGIKVYPGDVEAVVERFEAVDDCCSFAFDEPLHGQNVAVAVALSDGAALGPLREWTARHLAAHQMPRRWYVVERLPRSERGKINRSEVAARCAALEPAKVDRG